MAERVTPTMPMAAQVLAEIKRHSRGKVIRLKDVIAGRAMAKELQTSVASPQRLGGMHPAHAAYTYAQNQVSVLSEMITGLDAMAPLADMVAKAQDDYMPGGPPMSPLTVSYFTCWAFFDASVGAADETIGTTIVELGAAFGMHTELLRLVRLMQQSSMGLYLHEGMDGGLAILRDLATDGVYRCVVPAGDPGKKGQLWYARVLPPPLPEGSEHVVFTTPYILVETPQSEWLAYLRRVLPVAPPQARIAAYARHLKFGPAPNYWNEFVFEGYVGHTSELIFLEGLPDLAQSRPQSEAARCPAR